MAQSPLSKCLIAPQTKEEEERNHSMYQKHVDQISTLPYVHNTGYDKLSLYDGWYAPMNALLGAMAAQQLFQAKRSDILVATNPKSGTTWLKSLLFATVYRDSPHYDPHQCLTALGAHECVPIIERQVYRQGQVVDLDLLPSPRLFGTHTPFRSLPNSVVESECKVIYLCRNIKDNFVSFWHFYNKISVKMGNEPYSLEEALDLFCAGTYYVGPFWDHVLGYWNASVERPDRVFFIRYEELMEDTLTDQLKKLAEFVGCPFTEDEEKQDVAQNIVSMCKFERLSNLGVNKIARQCEAGLFSENNMLFRRGVVGDWVNYLTPEMAQRLDEITESKFKGTGLNF